MFKVKVTVVGALGDEKKYPCHFNYKVGDEIIWTGAEFKGRICPDVLPMLAEKVAAIYAAGPRYINPAYYYPFFYAPVSEYDPSYKKYDGIGFKPVLKTLEDDKYGMSLLKPPNAFKWPPHPERTVARHMGLTCRDSRTSMMFKLEAFDIADDGDCVTYYRRMMVILDRISPKPGMALDQIINEFTKEEVENIYPSLSQILVGILVEELELMGYLEITDGKATVTDKGVKKAEAFKSSLTAEEREALNV